MITQKEYDEFRNIIKEIVNNDSFQKMKEIKQHRFTNCYEHSVNVATKCFIFAKKRNINIDVKSLVRGALLHDFYLYDWRENKKKYRSHSFTHPRIALENSIKEFGELNNIEKDIILSHMWPVTFFKFPKYKESFLVCFSDKICALKEFFGKVN